jgi:hypothetical protein
MNGEPGSLSDIKSTDLYPLDYYYDDMSDMSDMHHGFSSVYILSYLFRPYLL